MHVLVVQMREHVTMMSKLYNFVLLVMNHKDIVKLVNMVWDVQVFVVMVLIMMGVDIV
jgi:hypothetical protein